MKEGHETSDNVATVRIVEAWNSFDFVSMFEQLGVLRLEETAAEPPDADEALPSLD